MRSRMTAHEIMSTKSALVIVIVAVSLVAAVLLLLIGQGVWYGSPIALPGMKSEPTREKISPQSMISVKTPSGVPST